jgi:hypothetical protein
LSLFATGVDSAGAALNGGTTDPHYSITASTDPGHTAPSTALVVNTNSLGGSWVANTGSTKWISVLANGCNTACGSPTDSYQYDFTTTFTMPAGATLTTASLAGEVAVDDGVTVRLNGTSYFTANGSGATKAFTIPAGSNFLAGSNTLTFHVVNSGGGRVGLFAKSLVVTSTAQCAVDGDCTSAQFCSTPTWACQSKLSNGTSIPNIAGHNPALTGVCSAAVGTAVCTSGVCDTADNKCGYADGHGTCTGGTAATVCRSSACSTTGACRPSGGCLADADCAANQFCNTVTLACTAKIANGGSIPTISNHTPALTGACTVPAGAAVCASAVCDADNKCGYADGGGTCNSGNGATVCRSGACSVNGTCKPASSCFADGDCTGAQFCNTQTGACVAKLANGAAIPTITGHSPAISGLCTGAVGTIVCAAGVCDTDNKCGYANGAGTCSAGNAAALCRSGVCDSADSKCGYANGHGSCTSGNAGTVCRSTACGSSGVCIPVGGCNVDADCAGTEFCNTQTFACSAKITSGSAIPNIANHTPPLTGTCNAAVGTAVCASGVCDTNDKCGYANGNGTCTPANAQALCQSGQCSVSGACRPAGGCLADGDCSAAQFCNTDTSLCQLKIVNGGAIPTISNHTPAIDGTCTQAVGSIVCSSGICDPADSRCGLLLGDGTCSASTDCRSGICVTTGANAGKCEQCVADANCFGSTLACDLTTNHCVACTAANPSACTGAAPVCDVGTSACVACGADNGSTGSHPCPSSSAPTCAPGGTCGRCAGDNDCVGSMHGGPICNPTSGTCGALCTTDNECSGGWCDNPTAAVAGGTCSAKLSNGDPIPSQAPLNGTCVGGVYGTGPRVCVSRVCDTTDNECGYPNGSPCFTSDVCRSGVCGSDKKCGNPNGVDCTSDASCRSGLCGPDGKCGLTNGTSCTAGRVCRSAICVAVDGKCGLLDGSTCLTNGDCRSGTCWTDGRCGIPLGKTCTDGSSCRSGACVAGTCSTTCAGDDECRAGTFCEGSACKTALPNGSGCVRPSQCASEICNTDGKCGDPDAAACTVAATCRGGACSSGACSSACTADTECAPGSYCTSGSICDPKLPNGSTCDKGGACVAGVCATDTKCGANNGEPCAVGGQCKSGICSATGHCAAACASDADCAAGSYCDTATHTCGLAAANGDKPAGAACNRAAQCRSGDCGASGVCGAGNGEICGDPKICRSGVCDGADEKCGLANGNGPCTDGAAPQCRSGICDQALCGYANGDGPCSSSDVCASGKCNVVTQKCSACLADADCATGEVCDKPSGQCQAIVTNGQPCSRAAQCQSGVCASDGKCGDLDGAVCSGTTTCRSGACTAGHCGSGATPDAGADGGTEAGVVTDAAVPAEASADAQVGDAVKPDAATPGHDAGGGSAGSSHDAGAPPGAAEEPGGCGCVVKPRRGMESPATLVLVGLALLLRRARPGKRVRA